MVFYSYEFDFKLLEHVFMRAALVDRLRKGHTFKDDLFYAVWSVEEVMFVGSYGCHFRFLIESNMPTSMIRTCTAALLTKWAREIWIQLNEPIVTICELDEVKFK